MSKATDKKMDELKRGLRCTHCVREGIEICWPTECLDFDHRNPDEKLGNIREFLWHPEELSAELLKCDLVCANHHRILTRSRGVSEKTRAAIKVARNKPGDKERDSQIQKDLWEKNYEHRSQAVAAGNRTEQARENNRLAQFEAWNNPEIRNARVVGQKRAWANKTPEELSRKALKAWETRRKKLSR